MEEKENSFVMSFDPKTIQHLGIRMYSTLPPVIAELIANSYDADAENVSITLLDSNGKKEIIIEDDGMGMTFTELNNKFLRIGRNRRDEEGLQETPKGRKIIGKKGLGKLSFFGVAHKVEIDTKKNGRRNAFVMDWEDIKNSIKPEYTPEAIRKDERCAGKEGGTKISLKDIKRETEFNAENIAEGISKHFIVDPDFKIIVKLNDEEPIIVDNEKKYSNLDKQIEWKIPEDIEEFGLDYENKDKIKGYLFTTVLPISPKTNMKGITLFSRKKLVNVPEYFGNSESSHIFSYLTGWLEVDFIDDLDEDVIATNRQSLNWNHPEMLKLKNYLSTLINKLNRDWSLKRGEIRKEKILESTGININDWTSKLPKEVKENVDPIINLVLRNVESTEETKDIHNKLIKYTRSIAPEYTYWHYRNLHPEVKNWAEEDYKDKKDYYEATEKASKAYIRKVKDKAGVDRSSEGGNIDEAFKIDGGILRVTSCNTETEKGIQRGQHSLSKGLVAGCRNPLVHEFPNWERNLGETGLFKEQDCLDMLSLISHLSRRVDNSTFREEVTSSESSATDEQPQSQAQPENDNQA